MKVAVIHLEKALKYVGASRKEVNITFQMACVGVGVDFKNLRINAWKLKEFKDAVEKRQHLMVELMDGLRSLLKIRPSPIRLSNRLR